MRIGITGANGLVGRDLTEKLLRDGHIVNVLVRNNFADISENQNNLSIFCNDLSIKNEDLSDFLKNLDVIVHCAAEIKDESKMEDLHVKGTENLLNQCLKTSSIKHFVFLSSVGVYGFPETGLISEKSKLYFTNQYEKTKLLGETLVTKKLESSEKKYTILRPGPIISSKMSNNYLSLLTKYIDKGYFFYIGRKKTIFNFIHLNNVISSIVLIIKNKKAYNEVFNLCDQVLFKDLIYKICNHLNKKNKNFFYVPINIAIIISKLEKIYSKFPLNTSRIKVMTNLAVFNDYKISKLLNFKKEQLLDETIYEIVKEYKLNKQKKEI